MIGCLSFSISNLIVGFILKTQTNYNLKQREYYGKVYLELASSLCRLYSSLAPTAPKVMLKLSKTPSFLLSVRGQRLA
jgi:hypothetical protein